MIGFREVAIINKLKIAALLVFLFSFVFLAACSDIQEGDITKNAVNFTPGELPQELEDDMENSRVIMLGEFHGSREHQELLTDIAISLHERGQIDRVVLDDRHAFSWIFEDFVLTRLDEGVFVRDVGDSRWEFLQAIRDYNEEREAGDRLKVSTGDINFQRDQFITSMQFMRRYLEDSEPINRFLNNYRTSADMEGVLKDFRDEVKEKRMLEGEWNIDWNERVIDLIEIEMASREPREIWQNEYPRAHRLREDVVKNIADRYLENKGDRVLFNFSYSHAQKEHAFGIEKEWLAEHLEKTYSPENLFSVVLVPLTGEIRASSGEIQSIDLLDDPLDDELVSSTANIMGENQYTYLHLPAEDFGDRSIKIDLYHHQFEAVPSDLFDGLILIPEVRPLP